MQPKSMENSSLRANEMKRAIQLHFSFPLVKVANSKAKACAGVELFLVPGLAVKDAVSLGFRSGRALNLLIEPITLLSTQIWLLSSVR